MPKSKLNIASKGRVSTRWKSHDYGSKGYYFITICCQNRLRWMGEVKGGKMNLNPIGEVIAQEWQATNKKRSNVKLHEYVIMPDHIHGIIEIKFPIQSLKDDVEFGSPKNTIGAIIRGFKSATTVQVLEYISKHELHWRRGELTFAPEQRDVAHPTRRGELTFAPNASHEVSDPVASELTFAPEQRDVAQPTRRGELTFAPEQRDVAQPTRRGELTFAPGQRDDEHPTRRDELTFAPEEQQIAIAPKSIKLWQRGYYDRVIRDDDELKRIIRYISENPMRWSQKINEDSLL